MTKLDIESIAIIGAGPAGIAALYEFQHTNKDGTSTVGGPKSTNPAFSKVVAFEQKELAGGIWAPNYHDADIPAPPQEILETNKYANPDILHPRPEFPENLTGATIDNPVIRKYDPTSLELEWRRTGIYTDLFTNIPARFTRYSYLPNEEEYLDKSRLIYPFMTRNEFINRIQNFIEKEQLYNNIRVNSTVMKAHKDLETGNWVLTIRIQDPKTNIEKWYQESFDAIAIGNGHYTIPVFPQIEGMAEYNKKFPNVITHTKSYRSPEDYKDKTVIVVGGSISTINVLQYIVPVAKKIINAKRGDHKVFGWINNALKSKNIVPKSQIVKFSENGEVTFADGSTEKNIDKIVFTTGYHYHYPFLDGQLQLPGKSSKVGGLYKDTFGINDPTIGAIGVAISSLNFHTIEASAAALAGVWSGAKTLPTKQEQINHAADLERDQGQDLIYYYQDWNTVKERFIDPLHEYAAINRPNPMGEDGEFIAEIDEGVEHLEKLYYNLKDGILSIKDTKMGQE